MLRRQHSPAAAGNHAARGSLAAGPASKRARLRALSTWHVAGWLAGCEWRDSQGVQCTATRPHTGRPRPGPAPLAPASAASMASPACCRYSAARCAAPHSAASAVLLLAAEALDSDMTRHGCSCPRALVPPAASRSAQGGPRLCAGPWHGHGAGAAGAHQPWKGAAGGGEAGGCGCSACMCCSVASATTCTSQGHVYASKHM